MQRSLSQKHFEQEMMIEKLELIEIRILKKILELIKDGEQYRRRCSNKRYIHIEKTTDTIGKEKIAF